MSVQLTEQEQLEILKNWWKEYGKLVITSVITALLVYFAWTSWQERQKAKAESASATYDALIKIVNGAQAKPLTDADRGTAEHYVAQLKEKNGGSFYAIGAALVSAKLSADKGDLDKAATELKYVLDSKPDDATKQIAQLRLARVYIAKQAYADADAQLKSQPSKAFAAEFAEVRGDLLNAKGEKAAALTAYQQALAEVGADQQRGMLLQMKVDALKTPDIETEKTATEKPATEKTEAPQADKTAAPVAVEKAK